MDAVGLGAVEEFQGDVVFGPIAKVVGDAGLATTLAVVVPAFGEEEFGIEHGAKMRIEGAEGEVDGDDAISGLAEPAAILPLHARGFLAGLGMARVVDDADGLGIFVIARDDFLDVIAGARMIPYVGVEILLKRARRDVVERRDRLDTLALEIAELAAHVMPKMFARLRSPKTVGEFAQELGERRFERQDLIDGHP